MKRQASPIASTKEVRLSKLNQVFELNRERLIRVFTYYCSYGEPLNTNKMRSSKFIKFLRDSLLLVAEDSPVKKGKGPYGDNSASLRRPQSAKLASGFHETFSMTKVQADLLFKKHTGMTKSKVSGPSNAVASSFSKNQEKMAQKE